MCVSSFDVAGFERVLAAPPARPTFELTDGCAPALERRLWMAPSTRRLWTVAQVGAQSAARTWCAIWL